MAEPKEKSRSSKKRKKPSKVDKPDQPHPDADQSPPSIDASNGAERESTSPLYELCKVVVGSMPYSTTEEDIKALFKDVEHIHISRFADSGNFNGLAFLTFKNEEDALKSLGLNGTKMGHRNIKIERCRLDYQKKRKSESSEELEKVEKIKKVEEPKKVEKTKKLKKVEKTRKVEESEPEKVEEPKEAIVHYTAYIGNLSQHVKDDDIKALFDSSKVASIRLAINKKTGKFRGFGHIDFEDEESLEKAVKKNQVEFHGKPIKIGRAASNKI